MGFKYMNQEKIDQLANLLKRLNKGEKTAEIKQAAKNFLASISPAELSQAEQKLIATGLKVEDLRHLCSAHLEMVADNLSQLQANLMPGHMLDTFIKEHQVILSFLDKLETDRKSTRLNSSHIPLYRMPSSA